MNDALSDLVAELDDVREQWEHEDKQEAGTCDCDECRDAERERREQNRLYEQITGGSR